VNVPGRTALEDWERLRSEFPASGLYPILFGDADDFRQVCENLDNAADPADILQRSQSIDPAAWLAEQVDEDGLPDESLEDEDWDDGDNDDDDLAASSSAVDDDGDDQGEMGIVTHLDLTTGKPKPSVVIGLLPVRESWEVFASLNWGGWNDCPPPEVHCALHREWARRYGSEVVSLTGDIVQCRVARPPTDAEGSLDLARAQYAYCYDIVEQGTQTVGNLALGLEDSPYWYFWWD
jgi:hypothetical protein